ncbi:hypothetical protein CERZMDRAFT_45675, partial [Cercospora zeae-maydis SCOH1-5]
TAPGSRSIWRDIDRKRMEQQIQSLHRKQHISGRVSYTQTLSFDLEDTYAVPFEVERSLADDFAFIAASQPRVGYVTAAAVEQERDEPTLCVKLAANAGICPDVRRSFDGIMELLASYAKRGISRQTCQVQLFDIIVRLNSNRILGRLGSARFQAPPHMNSRRGPLSAQLRKFIGKNRGKNPRKHRLSDLEKLDSDIAGFEAAFAQLEMGSSEQVISNLQRVIRQAFCLTVDGSQLPDRLRALGFSATQLDVREVREVGKVANYWRTSRHLSICARRFHRQFAGATWRSLPTYKPSATSELYSQQFVHAEIQLLVHYELEKPKLMPRIIGVSKEACFLCDSFIRAHGQFSLSGAHRQVFPQWTIPDLKDFSFETAQRLRQALSQLSIEVNREYIGAQGRKLPHRPFPLQSAINLNAIRFASPSTSTIIANRGPLSHSDDSTERRNPSLGSLPSQISNVGDASANNVHSTR